MSVYFITVATESKYYFPYLLKTSKIHNYNLKILGFGEKWKGFNWRNKLVLEYLNQLKDDDIIFFIDAYDVIFVRNSDKIKDKFLELHDKHKFKIITGYDNILHSSYFNKIFVKLKFGTCNNTSLNAGTYGGYVKDVKNILQKILYIDSNDSQDDQVLLTKYCKNNVNDIYIDIDNELFLTIGTPLKNVYDFIEIEKDTNFIKYKNKYPFILHAPGSSFLDKCIIKLGLDNKCDVHLDIKYKYGTFIYYFNEYYYIVLFCILLLIYISIYT